MLAISPVNLVSVLVISIGSLVNAHLLDNLANDVIIVF
jgi:hypothetical protein